MKNITLKLDEGLLDRVRLVAVDEHKSVSRWVESAIGRELALRDRYEADRLAALDALRPGAGLPLGGTPLSREDAHAR